MSDVRCLECKRRIGWLQRRRGSSFCSPRHEADYHDRKLALDRLAGRVRASFGEAAQPAAKPMTVIAREWCREVLEGARLSASQMLAGRPRKWTRWFPGAAAGAVLVVLAVASGHARSPGRNAPVWIVVNLPDPPGYQESLPNRPQIAAATLASPEETTADN